MSGLAIALAVVCAVAAATASSRSGSVANIADAAVAVTARSVVGDTRAAAAAGEAARRLGATLDAVEKAVAFMGRHSGSANLDGGIGVRSVEGQFSALLARYWTRLPLWVVSRLKSIQLLAARVSADTKDAVRRATPAYYANAGQLLDSHSWDTYFPTRLLPMNSVAALLQEAADGGEDDFDEKFSDDCIHEFYGSEGRPRCSISPRCWEAMVMSEGRKDYFLTHQVFYLLTGINANCLYNLTVMAGGGGGSSDGHPLRGLLDKFCGRILVAATMQEKRGFPVADRDLFMEQIGLCGLSGYTEFSQQRWWTRVIGWQRANGCYGAFPGERVAPENFQPGRYGNYRRRRKRSEALMSGDGCLSHRTSVALDALVAFARRWVEAEAGVGGGDV